MKKHIELDYWGDTLRGYLDLPETAGPHPLVIMFHGFTGDCTEKKFLLARLARELSSQGIASLRLSFKGSGESDGNFIDTACQDQADQADRILNLGKGHIAIDPDRILLLGMSMGSCAAVLTAQKNPGDIKGLILLAPAFRYAEKYLELYDEADIFWHGNLPVGRRFLEDAKPETFRRALEELDLPVHFYHGTKDTSVSPEVSAEFAAYASHATVTFIEDADHSFDSQDGFNQLMAGVVQSAQVMFGNEQVLPSQKNEPLKDGLQDRV